LKEFKNIINRKNPRESSKRKNKKEKIIWHWNNI
jgi:hypothetical protein